MTVLPLDLALIWSQNGTSSWSALFQMPNLSIKNVPETVVEKLRRRAEGNHRSLQGELLTLVCRAVAQPDQTPTESASDSASLGWMSVDDIHDAWRNAPADAASAAPLAVDIIRKDRDRR